MEPADIQMWLDSVVSFLTAIGFNVGPNRYSLLTAVRLITIIAVCYFFAKIVMKLVRGGLHASHLDAAERLLIEKLANIVILTAFFFLAIEMLNIDLTTFAIFSGAFGLAVGFGLQKTFGNLIAGIILLMDRSIKPGDVIALGDSFGKVNKIGVRAVSIITREGKEHLIPNENLMTQEVENWSFSSRNVRIKIPVGVSYDSDLKYAQKLMLDAAQESPRVLQSPPPNVRLQAFGNSSVDHELLIWIQDPEEGVGNLRSEVLNRLWSKFKNAGISIPYPQRDVHLIPNLPASPLPPDQTPDSPDSPDPPSAKKTLKH